MESKSDRRADTALKTDGSLKQGLGFKCSALRQFMESKPNSVRHYLLNRWDGKTSEDGVLCFPPFSGIY